MIKKSRKLITICAVLIALIASTTAAYAYFTDYEEAQGGAQIKLEGQTGSTRRLETIRRSYG